MAMSQNSNGTDNPNNEGGNNPPEILIFDSDGDIIIDGAISFSTPENSAPSSSQSVATLNTPTTRCECLRSHLRPRDAQHICEVVQQAYNEIKECVVGFGIVRDSEDDMEWQPELERPVYLVRMLEEESCYQDGAFNRS